MNNSLLSKPLSISAYFILLLIMTEFLGWRYIGPLSCRNIAVIITIVMLLFSGNLSFKRVEKQAWLLFIYYCFILLLGFINDLYVLIPDFPLTRVFPCVVIYLFIVSFVNDKRSFRMIVYSLLIIGALDAVVSILQGLGNNLGWLIGAAFIDPNQLEVADEGVGAISEYHTFGLVGTTVSNGYFLATTGLLSLYLLMRSKKLYTKLLSLVLVAVFVTALFYNQQRAAFYVFCSIVSMSLLYILIFTKSLLQKYFILLSLLVLIITILRYDFFPTDIGRLSNITADDIELRHLRHHEFYREFMPNNLFLGNRTGYILQYGQTPHNMVIETLLLGGVFGLLLYALFVVSICKEFINNIIKKHSEAVLFCFPIIVLLLISWEHSSGYHTAMSLGIYYLGLFDSLRRINKQ
ncbi:MAG: hypothetical protein IK103_08865 [Bacteroidales bacterium]|nr:hypothetical protein [Bacteroidales bacterium]